LHHPRLLRGCGAVQKTGGQSLTIVSYLAKVKSILMPIIRGFFGDDDEEIFHHYPAAKGA
jgi:hypothetical protein